MLFPDANTFCPSEDPPKARCDSPKRSSAARKGDGSSSYLYLYSLIISELYFEKLPGTFSKCSFFSQQEHKNHTPYGNIEHTTNAAATPMVVPCRGTPTSVSHVAATRVAPQKQGAA